MRLIITQNRRTGLNVAHVINLYMFDERIVAETYDEIEWHLGEYSSKENCEFAFKDLTRRLTEDQKMIDVMTNEQVLAELKKRRGDRDKKGLRDLNDVVMASKEEKEWKK